VGVGLAAGVVSGLPSTLAAVVTGRPVLEAARAAGALLGRPSLPRGLLAHGAVSAGWGVVLSAVLEGRRHRIASGAAAGAAVAALDLGLVGRRIPAIRSLPLLPQVADHLLYGAALGALLHARERGHLGQPCGRLHLVDNLSPTDRRGNRHHDVRR
jgi:hypothetical protein